MTPKNDDDTEPQIEVIKKKTDPDPDPAGVHKHDKRRRHGYRGYPNNPEIGGNIHAGTGFAGVGSTSGGVPEKAGIIGEKTQESVEEAVEAEEDEE
jgi:hypothetical protein